MKKCKKNVCRAFASMLPAILHPFALSVSQSACITDLQYGIDDLHRRSGALRKATYLMNGDTADGQQGDSITESWGPGGFAQRMAEYYNRKLDVINRGFGGRSTSSRSRSFTSYRVHFAMVRGLSTRS